MKITCMNFKLLLVFLLIQLLFFISPLAEGAKGPKELLDMADKKGIELSPERRKLLEEAAERQEKEDAEYYKYLKDFPRKWMALRGKWKTVLIDKVQDTNRIEIRSTAVYGKGTVLHVISGNNKVKEFLSILEITESGTMCSCHGSALLVFLKGDGEIAELSWHHGSRLRWHNGPWLGDAFLTKRAIVELPKWFDAQGYSGFNDGVAEALKEQEYFQTARRTFILITTALTVGAILFIYGIYIVGKRILRRNRNT